MSQRTKILLALLGLALLLALWKQFGPKAPPPSPTKVRAGATGEGATSRGRSRGGQAAGAEIKDASQLAELRLGDLDTTPPGFSKSRNPFAFWVAPPPPPPPPPPGPTAADLAAKAAAAEAYQRAQAEQRAIEKATPKPPAITFAYVGSFGPPSRRIAVLSDGASTYNAMVGEVIAGKFRLEAIGFESIDIGYVDFPDLPAVQLPVGEEGGS